MDVWVKIKDTFTDDRVAEFISPLHQPMLHFVTLPAVADARKVVRYGIEVVPVVYRTPPERARRDDDPRSWFCCCRCGSGLTRHPATRSGPLTCGAFHRRKMTRT